MTTPLRLPLLLLLCLLATSAQARLLPCPECTNPVSTLARFCPSCGCVIEEILKAEQSRARAAEETTHRWKRAVVELRSDRAAWPGVVVDFPDGRFVLSPLAPLEAVESLVITASATSNNLPYASIELAETAGWVRLAAPSTTVAALALAAPPTNAVPWRVEPLWAGAGTHLVSAAAQPGPDAPLPAAGLAALKWRSVKPAEFRAQSRLLRDARAATRPDTALRVRLKNTTWLTPYLQKQGLQEAERLDKKAS